MSTPPNIAKIVSASENLTKACALVFVIGAIITTVRVIQGQKLKGQTKINYRKKTGVIWGSSALTGIFGLMQLFVIKIYYNAT